MFGLRPRLPVTEEERVWVDRGFERLGCLLGSRRLTDARVVLPKKQGWTMSRLGYLSEVIYGYALARFAQLRGETQPTWILHLSTNQKSYFKQSAAWLRTRAESTR